MLPPGGAVEGGRDLTVIGLARLFREIQFLFFEHERKRDLSASRSEKALCLA